MDRLTLFLFTFCLMATSSLAAEPTEVTRPAPYPLPPVWNEVRAGHWMHGANWPWDNYGTDFSATAWGDLTLSNQGPAGWRGETRQPNSGARRLFWASRGENDFCLGVDVELQGPSASALAYFRFDESADKPRDPTINLAGQTITVNVYLPVGVAGPPTARNGVLLFFQDIDWTWGQNAWTNIEVTDKWITLVANLNEVTVQTPNFDAARIRTVGIKIGTNDRVSTSLQWGRFYVDNMSASQAPEISFEFFSPDTRTEEEMKTFSVNGTLLRWWILADLRAGLVFDTAGRVVGLREDFLKNLDEWLRLSRSSKTYLMPVLFDFLVAGTGQTVDGVQTFGRADLIMDAEKRASLLDKAIAPIFEKLSSSTEVAVLDLFNEPEWALRDVDIDIPTTKRPHEIPAGGLISLATMRTFFSELVELARQKGIKAPITVGSASPRWVTLWEGLGLELTQFHFYNAPGQIDDGRSLPTSAISTLPTFLGEYATTTPPPITCEAQRTLEFGYTGAFAWSWRGKDTASLPQLGERTKNCMRTFSAEHGAVVGFPGTTLFKIASRGGAAFVTDGSGNLVQGYVRVQPESGSAAPAGLAIFGYRRENVLVSEAAVPAINAVRTGRLYAETSADAKLNTGIALANPNSTSARITFEITDTDGVPVSAGTFNLAANQQRTAFLDAEPFLAPKPVIGTLSFSSDVPIGVTALRTLINERGDFLMTTLPVIDTALLGNTGSQYVPLFAVGAGFTTHLILINPTDIPLNGSVQFFDQGGPTTPGQPTAVAIAGIVNSTHPYTVAPRSALRLSTGATAVLTQGSVRVAPAAAEPAPVPLVVFTYKPSDYTLSEAGVEAVQGIAFRLPVEASGITGMPGGITTGVAVANTIDAVGTVTLELTTLEGAPAGIPIERRILPAAGQLAGFLTDFFPTLPRPFRGVLRITTTTPGIAVIGIRSRYNEVGSYLMTTVRPANEATPSAGELFIPHIANGDGFSTELLLFIATPGQSNGNLQFLRPDGSRLGLILK